MFSTLRSVITDLLTRRSQVGFLLLPVFSKGDTETRSVGGRERHTADAEIFSMGGRERPTTDPQVSNISSGFRHTLAIEPTIETAGYR